MCVCVFHEYNNILNLRCLQIMIENQFIIFKTDKNKEKELDIYLNFLTQTVPLENQIDVGKFSL